MNRRDDHDYLDEILAEFDLIHANRARRGRPLQKADAADRRLWQEAHHGESEAPARRARARRALQHQED